MDRLIGLEEAVDRLLHRRSYRRAFLEERHEELCLGAEDLAALATIDRAQLEAAAARVRFEVLHRKHRGSGRLLALYPRTIEAWRGARPDDADLDDLIGDFFESDTFERYREIPFAGAGISIEEAFFHFAEARAIGDEETREREFLAAMIRALTLCPRPDFLVPEVVRDAPAGRLAVTARGMPVLFASLRGRYVTGPITALVRDVLLERGTRDEVARRHGVDLGVFEQTRAELAAMGLLDEIG